jgi:hypothetical protein
MQYKRFNNRRDSLRILVDRPASLPVPPRNKTFYLIVLLIIATTVLAYSPLPWNKFVIYDDPEYVTENLNVLHGVTLSGISWAFSSIYQSNWHPLTWLSHMLDAQLYGLNPVGHHLTSLLLHIANSLLVLIVLRRMTGDLWKSALVALLFAVHPLHVESVAWVAERKDLLCALFWLLTMQAYLFYTELPGWRRYLLLLGTFALGIMSKPMIVTLPCVLLLLDYWPLHRNKRIGQLILEKIPLLVMSAGCSIITYRAQLGCGRSVIHDLPAQMNALQAYAGYLVKTVWPVKLAVLYPFDESALTPLRSVGAALVILSITIATVTQIRKRPYLCVGWFWFLIALLPVIGIFRIGYHSLADRYTYLPHIGLFIMVVWGLAELQPVRSASRRAAVVVVVLVFCVLGSATYKQVKIWENTITLMTNAVTVADNNWFAYNNLACAYYIIGTNLSKLNISASLPRYPGSLERRIFFLRLAIENYTASLRIKPDGIDAANNLKLAVSFLEKLEREQTNPYALKNPQ